MDDVKLVWVTPEAEKLIAYTARVSSPQNQGNEVTAPKLLKYCLEHGHWSPFEMVSMCVEINTSRAIARQILRHRSFAFQEFSLRYAEVLDERVVVNPRRQDTKNRQNSIDDLSDLTQEWFIAAQKELMNAATEIYNEAINLGIAKECARAVLPEGLTPSRLYMTGSARSWIHYLKVRLDPSTQLEHRLIAEEIKEVFSATFPTISEVLNFK